MAPSRSVPSLRIALTGASGFLGSALVPHLRAAGHTVLPLVRRDAAGPDEIAWNPAEHRIDGTAMEGLDAVLHLAGENIAGGRWTPARQAAIRQSRVVGTAFLARSLAALARPPAVLVCASAVGFYGDTGDRPVDEASPPGHGFLADVCQAWEAATAPAQEAGMRVVNLRMGVVLSARGGALARMLPPFRMGVGGPIGNGQQWFPWIHLDDVLAVWHAAVHDPQLAGAVNVVAPGIVRQAAFARALGHALGRPAVVPLPALAVRLLFGQMGEELLLAGQRAVPRRLTETGFPFEYPDLAAALNAELATAAPVAASSRPA